MNMNVWIGIVAAIVILGGGYWLFTSGGLSAINPTATTTPSTPGDGSQNPTQTPSQGDSTAGVPTVVTDAKAVPSNSTAVVTGRVTPGGAPTTYWYEYDTSTTLGNRTTAQAIGSGMSAIPSPGYITGLRANTTYYFRLSAQNRYGTVNGATYTFTTNDNPPPQGHAPSATTNAASDVSRTSAMVNARVNPNDAPTTVWFEYGLSTDLGSVTALQALGDGTASINASAPLANLNPLTKYYFRVNAQNQYGTVNGTIQSFTTKGPAAPGVPSADTTAATNVATSSAALNGRVSPNGAQTTYWFEYGTDSLLGQILGSVSASQEVSAEASTLSVSLDVSGLSKNTRYYYRLVARNQYGTVRGDIVNFKTRP